MPNRSGFYESTEALASPPLQEALHAQVLNLSGLTLACHPLLVVLFDSLSNAAVTPKDDFVDADQEALKALAIPRIAES